MKDGLTNMDQYILPDPELPVKGVTLPFFSEVVLTKRVSTEAEKELRDIKYFLRQMFYAQNTKQFLEAQKELKTFI